MKILYLNIFEGAKEKERFNKIISFVKKIKPDILALSELDGWKYNQNKKLNTFKKKTNLPYSNIPNKNTGIFSIYPILKVTNTKHSMTKAEFKIKNEKISLTALHLNHKSENTRLEEIKTLLKHISPNEKLIILGDFNSLSPLDKYNEEELLKYLKKIKLKKFGTTKLRKDVHKKLLNLGLIDTTKKFSKSFEHSVPTKFNKEKDIHFTKLRLDYIYITPNLLPKLKSSEIIRNKETNQLSDHFPIMAELEL